MTIFSRWRNRRMELVRALQRRDCQQSLQRAVLAAEARLRKRAGEIEAERGRSSSVAASSRPQQDRRE